MAEAFQGLVVEIDVGELDVVLAEGVGIDREAVVLGRDLDPAVAQILDRMIAAAVSELQFVGLSAEGQAEELMAEADTEDGNLPDEMADVLLRVCDRLRIARPVGR